MDKEKTDLIKNAINGDKNSISKLIKQEQNNIYTTLFYLKKDDNELYDILQDVLIKLNKKITQLKNPLYFKTWLNQIVINSYYDYLRKNKRKIDNISLIKSSDNTPIDIPDYRTNPQDTILYNELDYIIKHTIENMPMHYKIPIALREIQGLSYDEISNITKTSIGTIKSRIARARAILKEKVDEYIKE